MYIKHTISLESEVNPIVWRFPILLGLLVGVMALVVVLALVKLIKTLRGKRRAKRAAEKNAKTRYTTAAASAAERSAGSRSYSPVSVYYDYLDKQERKELKKRGWWKFVPLLYTFAFAALGFILILIYIKIFLSAPILKWFFVPVVLLYFAALAAAGYWLGTRTARLKEREFMGDEWFFNRYPLERWLNRWSKTYRNWQLKRIRQIRAAREARSATSEHSFAVAEKREQDLKNRGPELQRRKPEFGFAKRMHEASLVRDREKYRKSFEAKQAKELGRKGPDLPDSGFASWNETSKSKKQIIE